MTLEHIKLHYHYPCNLPGGCFSAPFYHSGQQGGSITHLIDAVNNRNYSGIYAVLRKLDAAVFPPDIAEYLCVQSLACNKRVLSQLLPHMPAPSLSSTGSRLYGRAFYQALMDDQHEHLELLLGHGVDPAFPRERYSPLAVAAHHGSLHCVELLLKDPRTDRSLNRGLNQVWAGVDNQNTLLDFCIQSIARDLALPGAENFFLPLPIPQEVLLQDAAVWENWDLILRLCRERSVDPDDAMQALRLLPIHHPRAPEVVAALLTACPGLLRRQFPRQMLVGAALVPDEGIPPVLKPLLKGLEGQKVVLSTVYQSSSWSLIDRYFPDGHCSSLLPPSSTDAFFDLLSPTADDQKGEETVLGEELTPGDPPVPAKPTWGLLLDRWRDRLGDRIIPVLNRRSGLPMDLHVQDYAKLLSMCRIVQGRPSKGGLSPLAVELLAMAPTDMFCRELLPDGLLREEDPQLMLSKCRQYQRSHQQAQERSLIFHSLFDTDQTDPNPESRDYKAKANLILAHLKKEACYDL